MPVIRIEFWIAFSLLLHLIAPFFNVGYQYHDEYFQIIEFASYKLGITPSNALAWEFHQQIRSWFLPQLVYLIFKLGQFLGLSTPSSQILLVQTFFSLFGWGTLVLFYKTIIQNEGLKSQKRMLWLWVGLFWFFPYFHVRTSSENISTSLWLIGFCLWMTSKKNFRKILLSGVVFGFAFLARFQIVLMTTGLVLWKFASTDRKKSSLIAALKETISLSLGFLLIYFLGFIIDYWGYGTWTHSAWNYLRINLIEHRADDFGVFPWWFYFRLFMESIPLGLGYFIPYLFILGFILFPMSPLTWASLPFLLVHLVIGHKEPRFLYPIIPFFPYYFARIMERTHTLPPRYKFSSVTKALSFYLVTASALLLLPAVFKAERNPFRWMSSVSQYPTQQDFHLVGWAPDPFIDVLPIHFYRPRNYHYTQVKSPKELENLLETHDQLYVFRPESTLLPEYQSVISHCQLVYEVFGKIYQKVNFNQWLNRAGNWGLYSCRK